ncbi:LysR family transcriptional regulator [Emcibacter sp.]|uniref:LysR family transcriptional regulator n=1 Tax=Emcibacter sp. TaxID=1979954 RepID=UPI002AA9274A|nr:LysR family transcriptional regulator [Emcibacter sp.]
MIELRDLQLVTALAREGSFNRAAETLNMSQPALTKKIARLEDKLGVTLFHRSRRGTTPTVFGSYLLDQGKQLMDQGEILHRQIMLMANMELGELRLGVGPVVEQNLLSGVLANFLSRFPKISVDVRVDSAVNLLHDLKEARLDLAVGAFDLGGDIDNLQASALADQAIIFAARPDHPLFLEKTPGTGISVAEMLKYPLTAPRIPDYIQDWFAAKHTGADTPLTWGVKCENYNVLRAVAKATDHVTGGPVHLFMEDFDKGELRPVPLAEDAILRTAVLTRPEALHSPAVTILTEIFMDVAESLVGKIDEPVSA